MAVLRVVLDQVNDVVDADQAEASLSLVHALARTAPPKCEIETIVPAGGDAEPDGVGAVHRLGLARRELAAAWQLGMVAGVGAA